MSNNWWQEAVIYQIYPSSFKDSNGDGWGDLKGIISKVDYLKQLGVDIVWISPIYKSPQADMGYDIADYKLIDPIYGTNDDIDVLVTELSKRGMKLMMDLVVNHTSEEHAWFLDSRKSKSSPKRDWYIWKDPKGFEANGDPIEPNNWCQLLGDANSAWTFDKETKQYYLSLFTPEQPDLNWENEDVRGAVHDVMGFWLEKGVCGYRMDVINLISKDQRYPDAKETKKDGDKMAKYQPGLEYFVNGPRMHEYLHEINDKILKPYKAVTVGEMPAVSDVDEILRTVGQKDGELSMIFIMDLVDLDNVPGQGRMALREFSVKEFARIVEKWQLNLIPKGGWNSVFLENHDNPRSTTRYCDSSDQWREKSAKLLALLQTTLSGTIFVYQGEEIGIRNMPPEWDVSEYKDIESINFWKKSLELHKDNEKALSDDRRVLDRKARDHARTPMQWDSSPHAGFCEKDVKPWMRVNDDFVHTNVAKQVEESDEDDLSVWKFWQRGLANRKEHPDAFVHGGFEMVDDASHGSVFAYKKKGSESRWLVALNFSGGSVEWSLPESAGLQAWVAGNYVKGKPEKATKGTVSLQPWEGLLGKCS